MAQITNTSQENDKCEKILNLHKGSVIPMQNTTGRCKTIIQLNEWSVNNRVILHLFTGSLASIGKLAALAGRYISFGIFFSVRFGGSSILWNFVGTLFCKFSGNSFFPQKGGLVHQKGGRSLPLREKRDSCQMYNTKMSRPSFPSVLVGKIPGKYQLILKWNTKWGIQF